MNPSPTASTTTTGADESPAERPAWFVPAVASVLCLALGSAAIPTLSGTIDEASYVGLGVKSWYGDRDRLVPMGALPCFSWVQNVPGALYLKSKYGGLPRGPGTDIETQMETADQLVLIRLARWTNLLVSGLGTVWSVWWVTKRWLGPRAAGAAALFAAVEPNLLASYTLATTDAPTLPFTLLSATLFDSYLRKPSAWRLLGVAVLVGLGTAVKVSVLPIGLILMGSCLVARALASTAAAWDAARWLVKASPRFLLVDVPAVVALALALSWAANGFLMGRALEPGSANKVAYKVFASLGYPEDQQSAKVARLQSLMVPAPVSVLRSQVAHSRGGHPMMFRGRVGVFGPWYYYPYVFALKTHLVMLALGFVALASRDVRRSPFPLAALLLVALSCTTKLQQGPRYFLTLYTVWAAMAGAGAWVILDRLRDGLPRKLLAGVLAAASLALTALSAPDYLGHASPLWGGDREGYRYADANFDWGQGALLAIAAADERGLMPVAYFSTGTPFLGIPRDRDMIVSHPFRPTDELPARLRAVEATLKRIRGKFVAVPLRSLYGPLQDEAEVPIYRAFRETTPVGRLTTLYLYYDLRTPEQFAAFEPAVRRQTAAWVQEWEAGRRSGATGVEPFSPDPRVPLPEPR